MAFMGGIEAAAQQPDAQARRDRSRRPYPMSQAHGAIRAGSSRAGLPVAADDIFEGGELLGAHRTARMHLAGADTDLRAHAELTTVRELRGGIPQHDGAVDAVHEGLGG